MFTTRLHLSSLSLLNILLIVGGYRSNYQHSKPDIESHSKWISETLEKHKRIRGIQQDDHVHAPMNGRSLGNNERRAPGQSRITGGRLAEYGEANYQAFIFNYFDHSTCGGTLVEINNLRFVLTAAHCLWVGEDRGQQVVTEEYLLVRAATIDYNVHTKERVDFNVSRIVCHPYNDPRFKINDIAILFLNKFAHKFGGMSTIELPGPDFDVPDWYTISGFGTRVAGGAADGKLRVVDVPHFSQEECKKIWHYVTHKQFCVANTDYQVPKGDCYGDSGGPVVAYNWTNLKWFHYGVVSAGLFWECGKPSLHTRVSQYYDWIRGEALSHIAQCGTGHPKDDPPARYPGCRWPYSDPCYRDNSCKVDQSIFPDQN